MPTTTRRAVGYVRVSVARAGEQKVSPEMQRQAIESYCSSKGWQLVEVVSDLNRSAGEGKDRPGLARVKAMITANAADVVVVWKLDRLARSVVDFGDILRVLKAEKAHFASVTEAFDTTTPMGRAMSQMVMVFAELELENIRLRNRSMHVARREQGLPPNGRPGLGYRKVARDRWELELGEAAAVRATVAAVLATRSLAEGVRTLEAAGYPLTTTAVRNMLLSPTVAGLRLVDGVETAPGSWPAIITTGERAELLALFAGRKVGRPRSHRWLLTGIASCGACGRPLHARPSEKGRRYRCSGGADGCYLSVDADATDAYVSSAVLSVLDADAWRRLRTSSSTTTARLDTTALEAELAELAGRYASGELTRGEWDVMRPILLERLEADTATAPPAPVLPDVADLAAAWHELSCEARRLVVQAAVAEVVVAPSGQRGAVPPEDRIALTWRV